MVVVCACVFVCVRACARGIDEWHGIWHRNFFTHNYEVRGLTGLVPNSANIYLSSDCIFVCVCTMSASLAILSLCPPLPLPLSDIYNRRCRWTST